MPNFIEDVQVPACQSNERQRAGLANCPLTVDEEVRALYTVRFNMLPMFLLTPILVEMPRPYGVAEGAPKSSCPDQRGKVCIRK